MLPPGPFLGRDTLKRCGPPEAAKVMLPPGPFVGHFRFRTPLSSVGDPPGGKGTPPWSVGDPPYSRGYVTTGSICGPVLILSPALKVWGPPRRQGLCYHRAHLWATSDSVTALKRWGPLILQGLCYHRAHLWATSDSVHRSEVLGTPHIAGVMLPPGPFVGHF